MLTHEQIWTAIDHLATRAGLSPSGLARRSGLDPTTFNKSKRVTSAGRMRWPSTESVAKALAATGIGIDTFVQFIAETGRASQTVPLMSMTEAGRAGHFDDKGFPIGKSWNEIALLSPLVDEHIYALEIAGESIKPTYRDGEIIVVSPAAPVRRGDRVVVKATNGEIMVKELRRRTVKGVELQSLNPDHENRTLVAGDVAWVARIVWARQ